MFYLKYNLIKNLAVNNNYLIDACYAKSTIFIKTLKYNTFSEGIRRIAYQFGGANEIKQISKLSGFCALFCKFLFFL
jgi:hypothetical protein